MKKNWTEIFREFISEPVKFTPRDDERTFVVFEPNPITDDDIRIGMEELKKLEKK